MSQAIKVMVRCRPMNKKEIQDQKSKPVVTFQDNLIQLRKKTDELPKNFAYDNVFPNNTPQSFIYQNAAFSLVESVLQGYNGTIFAYGQTGCGKTYTMMGVQNNQQLKGIIPRTFQHIVRIIQNTPSKKFLVRVSFLQIYNQQVHDLLSKNTQERKEVHQSNDKGIYVKDLTMMVTKTIQEMLSWMDKGFNCRATGATQMNQRSSRSHSIFTIHIESQEITEQGEKFKGGKLNLVDLAGSQRLSKTKVQGDRLKEATKINLSLSALGNVISSLVDGKSAHIPYRDSKLTRLLQDSLGGNTKTIMIANISPADYNYDQTLSTLRYASRAKFIKNKPKINEDPKDALLREYANQIKKLKQILQSGGTVPVVTQSNNNIKPTISISPEYQSQLEQKQQLYKKQKMEKELIMQKMKSLEQNLMNGGQKKNQEQNRKYKQMKVKIKKQKDLQNKLVQQKKRKQQQLFDVQRHFNSIKQQNEANKQLVNQLRCKYKQAINQVKDISNQNTNQKEQLLQTIRGQDKLLKMYEAIMKVMLTNDQLEILKSNCQYNDQKNQYKCPQFYFKQKSLVFPKLSQYHATQFVNNQKEKMQLHFGHSQEIKHRVQQDKNEQRRKKYLQNNKNYDNYQQRISSYSWSMQSNENEKQKQKKTYMSTLKQLDVQLAPLPNGISNLSQKQHQNRSNRKLLDPLNK